MYDIANREWHVLNGEQSDNLIRITTASGAIGVQVVAKGKWKGVPGMYVAARKSQVGGLWPYVDNHDYKDRTAKLDDTSSGQQDDEFYSFDPSKDGRDDVDFSEGDGDGECDEVGDEERGPVVDWAEGGVRGPEVGAGTRRRRPRALPAASATRGRGSSEERESQAMFEENVR